MHDSDTVKVWVLRESDRVLGLIELTPEIESLHVVNADERIINDYAKK